MARNVKIEFEPGDIATAARLLNQYATEMYQIRDELKSSMQRLVSSDWRGKASEVLLSVVGDEWSSTVDRYCDLMLQLTTIMNDVSDTYDNLASAGERLELNI